jgi:hypothetical protein
MRLLVLGGGWFLGRAVVEEALARGWRVATFNRGRTGRDVAGVEAIRGDRTEPADVARLAGRGPWDVVVDTSGQEPWVVDLAASRLTATAGRYVFVSTVNAYQGWPVEPLDDRSPLRASRPDLRASEVDDLPRTDRYGTLKAGCELAVRHHVGDRALVLRPGVILGRYDYVGRLPWLLSRMRRGGQVLAGGPPSRPMVDHVYYGRGDRARIRLSDEQVRAIMDERARARSDIISELHRMVEDDPISAGDRRSGHLYLLTHPEFAPAEALVDFLSDRDSGRVIVQMMNGIVQDEPKDYPPSIGGLSGPSTRAEGRAFTSYHPEEGPRREEFTLEVVIREDGGVRLMCGRGTAEYRAPHTLDPPTMVVILGLVLSLARQIVTLAGQIGDQHAAYQGQWRLGILIDRLKGVLPADRLHPMSGSVGGPYSRDTYERITSATTEELTGAPRAGCGAAGCAAAARARRRQQLPCGQLTTPR